MNQQEIFEYTKKQYPANPERITQNGKQIIIFKKPKKQHSLCYFLSIRRICNVNHGSSGRVRYDKQLYRNVSLCSGKVHESETLAGSFNGWDCQ